MNKAISTALLLAAGTALANAASVYSNITSTASNNLVAAWNFENGADASYVPEGGSAWTWDTDAGFTASNGSATVNSSSFPNKNDSNGIGINANSFTVSFDVNNVDFGGNWKVLLALATNSSTGFDYAITLASDGSGNEGNLMVYLKPGTNAFGGATVEPAANITLGSISELLPANAWTTVTVTVGSGKLTVYLDGKDAGSAAFATDSRAVTGISFGERLDGESAISSANVDNVAIWNTALTAAQVAALPEPSAFGLLAGLGALALVAARRRRRSRKA